MKFKNKISWCCLILFLLVNSNLCFSQQDKIDDKRLLRNTGINVELVEIGAYDQRLGLNLSLEQYLINNGYQLSIQAGIFIRPFANFKLFKENPTFGGVVTVNQIFPLAREKHFLEFGIGLLLQSETYALDDYSLRMGYRFRKPDKKWEFRFTFVPAILNADFFRDDNFLHDNPSGKFNIPKISMGVGYRL